jgi:putative membrane protein
MRRLAQWSTVTLVVALMICGLAACVRDQGVEAAREDQPPAVSPAEQDFMMKATQAHLSEVGMARVALQKSGNGDVKDFANMIENDHSQALEDLTELMREKNMPQQRTIAQQTQQDIDRMAGLTGAEFDREFVNMMVGDHQKTVELFQDQQAIAQNPDVKDYVGDLLPELEMHLDKARRLQSKLFSAPNKR